MKNKNKLLLYLSASFALVSTAHTQEKDKPELSAMSVLGNKVEKLNLSPGLKSSLPANKIPQSFSVMSAEQIKTQGLKSVGDILDYTPGVTNSQGEGHRDAAVIRGMRTTQDFYRDGVRDDIQYYRPLYNVDQVEVLRGPNALVSGFGGGYGLINRVSKKGVIGESFNVASASVDTFGETVFSLDNNYELDENKALRVNMFGENLENHRDFYYGDSFGVNPTLRMDLGGSTLDLSYEYLNQERFIDRGIPTSDTTGFPIKSFKDTFFGDPAENYSTHEAHIFRLLYEHELTDAFTGRFSATYNDHDKLYKNLYANDYNEAAPTVVELDGYLDTTQRSTAIFSYEVDGQIETGGIVHNLIAGIEYLSMNNDNDRYYAHFSDAASDGRIASGKAWRFSREDFLISAQPLHHAGFNSAGDVSFNTYGEANSSNDDTHAENSVFSIYLQDEIELTDSLDLVLGVRFDNMDTDVVSIGKPAQGSPVTNLSDSDDTISPRAGFIFTATEQLSAYVSYSETFSPLAGDQYASLKESYSYVDPKSFENTEFGIRYDLLSGLSFAASYFEVNSNTPAYNVAAATYSKSEQEITGFELQLVGSITDKWFISAGYTDTDAKKTDGTPLREVPESVFSIWNNYLVTDKLAINLGVINQGESHIKDGSAQKLPSFTRVDAGANYALTENTTLGLNIENLTDELYFPHSHSTHQVSVGAPINAMFSITSSF
ncbi:MAG: TonB-dependent receptor [Opitutales bacterium]|nr:TonB-dependent receptor [Opitutales bacterium]